MRKHLLLALFLTLVFFVAALLTLHDYGVSWDETIHFRRGQAYLRYFLTGETNYDTLPKPILQGTAGDPQKIPSPRRSFYQNDNQNAEYFLNKDVGHPPINGELAALSNYVFFQKLGILDDISAHHVFNILTSSLLVFVVVFFTASTLGIFPAAIAFLALATYPLFWAESHFNVKDPPEAAFFAATIWLFYESMKRKSALWLTLSFLFFALALGTKFNALFIPIILIPFLLVRYRKSINRLTKTLWTIPKGYLLVLLLGPLLVLAVFVGTWPFLWQSFPDNLFRIFEFYKQAGAGVRYQPDKFFIFGFNTYPLRWIILTTSPLVLALTTIGIISALLNHKKYKYAPLLWLIWFLIPVLRVSIPGASIYGGIRQILEFLPAMIMLSGLGAWQIAVWVKRKVPTTFVKLVLVSAFAWPIFVLFKMHPNQNVYFNFLIGGLSGARQHSFPSWGNSFGNVYKQGIVWLNRNAEMGAKLTLIQGTPSNAPPILLRSDIDYLVGEDIDSQETYFSGIERKGEYLMELTFDDTGKDFYYIWEYVDKFLTSVYKVKVHGVAILKIWKNDLGHTKPEFRLKEKPHRGELKVSTVDGVVSIDLGKEVLLSQAKLEFIDIPECTPNGNIETSPDGKSWVREKDAFPQLQINRKSNVEGNTITYYFAARKAKHIKFVLENESSCTLGKPNVSVVILE